MATAVVVPALLAFDRELTSVAPRRTLPTWFRGDPRHQLSASGHNPDDTPGSKAEDSDADSKPEIRAGDYRLPLNASFTAEQLVQYLVKECRAGRITWIKYIIFNRRIWTASSGWVTRVYNGSNPHDKHFHLSCKPQTVHENNTKPVGLRKLLPVSLEDLVTTQAEFNKLMLGALADPKVAGYFRAFPWQYNGRGLGDNDLTLEDNTSTLNAFDSIFKGVRALVGMVTKSDGIDEVALAEALAPAVASLVIAAIPDDSDDVTVDELVEAFRRAVGGTPAEQPTA